MFFDSELPSPQPEPKTVANDDVVSTYALNGDILVFAHLYLFICLVFSTVLGFILFLFMAPRIVF